MSLIKIINHQPSQIFWIFYLVVLFTWEDLMRASEYDATGRRAWFCLGTGRGGRACECAGGGRARAGEEQKGEGQARAGEERAGGGRLKAFSGLSLLGGRPTRSL